MENKLPKRSEVDSKLTWNFEDLYKSEEDWQKALDGVVENSKKIAEMKDTALQSAGNLYELLSLHEKNSEEFSRAYGYASKRRDVDTADSKGQTLAVKATEASLKMDENTSFLEPLIISVSDETMAAFYEEKKELCAYKRYIDDIRRKRAHYLNPEMEKLLASTLEMSELPYENFATFTNADMKFPEVTDQEGKKITITNGRFVPLEENFDRELRKEVFEKFYTTFGNFKNTIAGLYAGQVKQLMFHAKARKYGSTLEAALDGTNVSEKVYENLVSAIHDNMDKMHRYVRLRKKLLGVDELHMYDVYVPIVSDYEVKFTIEEAKDLVLKAIRPMGEEYVSIVKKGFEKRWLDVVENEGKRGGAYSSGMYGVHPFVLLNFNGTLDNVFTLAHEMGHAMHSYYSNQEQSYFDSKYKIFVAEVASTTNEILLMEYLLKNAKSKEEKAYLLNHYLDSFKGTVFRQTMFAEFEKKSNEMAENGEPLTAENLTALYFRLNKEYFGSDMVSDPLIGNEWLRIPHFYYNFYVYQYATGFSAAVSIAKRILIEGEPAVKEYMKFLKSGCTLDPVSILKIAGVDMSTKEPINEALKVFDAVLAEMEELTEK